MNFSHEAGKFKHLAYQIKIVAHSDNCLSFPRRRETSPEKSQKDDRYR